MNFKNAAQSTTTVVLSKQSRIEAHDLKAFNSGSELGFLSLKIPYLDET